MLPCLNAFAVGGEVKLSEVRERVAISETLTDEDLREQVPSGAQSVFVNRTSWAVIHLVHAGLLERLRRGVYRLTPDGERLLSRSPSRIDMKLLAGYPRYREWRKKTQTSGKGHADNREGPVTDTPEEILARSASMLKSTLESDVLDRVRNAGPAFLERVVVDLLIRMGYGGGDPENGRVTGQTGDGGIDGTIREDALGLDEVYVQAKKYADGNRVGESELRNFAGAIDAAGTTKGVFVTTSAFTKSAMEYVDRSPKRIILIDGDKLAQLMVRHRIGVRTRETYEIKRIDEDYFDQEAL